MTMPGMNARKKMMTGIAMAINVAAISWPGCEP